MDTYSTLLGIFKTLKELNGFIIIGFLLAITFFLHYRLTQVEKRLCWLEDRFYDILKQVTLSVKVLQEIKENGKKEKVLPF